mgnify:CR=1 FL=1
MCGIIGIVGKEAVADRLVDGLRRMEYRGYDSAGVCTVQDGQLIRRIDMAPAPYHDMYGAADMLPLNRDEQERANEHPVLAAYREMLAAAKGERPDLFTQGGLFLLASAWRDPADDKASCTANPGPCNGTAKAVTCSAHWSGRAVDINLGFIAGGDPTDSTYANRLHQARSAAYAWMLDNAGRFGFVNYYYEPWHWEWQGDSP